MFDPLAYLDELSYTNRYHAGEQQVMDNPVFLRTILREACCAGGREVLGLRLMSGNHQVEIGVPQVVTFDTREEMRYKLACAMRNLEWLAGR